MKTDNKRPETFAEFKKHVMASSMPEDMKKLTLDIAKREAKRQNITLDELVRNIPDKFEKIPN